MRKPFLPMIWVIGFMACCLGEDGTPSKETPPELFQTREIHGALIITKFTGTNDQVSIPASIAGLAVNEIGHRAFADCGFLKQLTLSANITIIGEEAFSGCSGLTELVIPNQVAKIFNGAFSYCGALTNVVLPKGLTTVNARIFSSCGRLSHCIIPDGVTAIGDRAFEDSNLTDVVIPEGVTSIGNYAFRGCASLKRVLFLGNAPAMGRQIFCGHARDFAVYYNDGATGFTPIVWAWGDCGDSYPSVNLGALSNATNPLSGSLPDTSDQKVRIIRGVVLGFDGKPAANRMVTLRGISRNAVGTSLEVEGSASSYYVFKTDRRGRFQVRLWNEEDSKDVTRPCGSMYALVVEPTGKDAGAVSPKFYNPGSLPIGGLDLTMRVESGFTMKGKIVEYEDPSKPLQGVTVACRNDLNVDTHTGYGGEIFGKETITDDQGNFALHHLYPGEHPSLSVSLNWLRTKVNGQWEDRPVSAITPSQGTNSVYVEIQATSKNLFRYFGHVVSHEGNPIHGAEIVVAPSSCPDPDDWGNNHRFVTISVDEQGNYAYDGATPWVRFLRAQAEGFQSIDRDNPAPGKYDFVLIPEGK